MNYIPIIFLILVLSNSAFAVDFTVNRITDEHDVNVNDGICAIAGGGCTMRAAAEQANNLSSDDRILFDLPANSTITLTTANGGEISTINNGVLEIIGTGANNLTIDGGTGTNRIFYVSNNTILTVSGVTLTGGNAGGATANGFGGAIFTEGSALSLKRVHITGNTASASGGGVYVQTPFLGSTNLVLESTFSGNTAAGGCGSLSIVDGNLYVINSTISGNTATNNSGGGGICFVNNFAIVANTTITNNTSGGGGGISQFGGMLVLTNAIIAGNSVPDGITPEISSSNSGEVISLGGNLVGDSPGDATNTGTPIAYQPTDILDVNPMLEALQNNGGTTPTHALLAESPAIDKGNNSEAVDFYNNNSPLITDQRGTGFPRIIDGNGDGMATVDIGAYEKPNAPTAAPISIGGRIVNAKGRGIFRASVTLTNQEGKRRTALANPFGYYSFNEVRAGESYILSISSKQYTFAPRVVFASNDISDLNFTGN